MLVLSAAGQFARAGARIGVFDTISPDKIGLSPEKLDELVAFCDEAGSAALLIVHQGKVVLAWGEVETKYPVHSIRKSFLNSLYGIHVGKGDIDVNMTLAELGIDDIPPKLTETEKQAKVIDLLGSRSGVYHPAAAEAHSMIRDRPARGSHPPGTHYYYNNWDFNVLGTIFTQRTGRDIYEAFDEEIARPLGMKDFTPADGELMYQKQKSLHPAYHFNMTAHDMALFGMLYLHGGKWNGRQIVPADWIAESLRPRSLMIPAIGLHYGLLWYVLPDDPDLGRMFFHTGAGVHLLGVCPDLNVVVVHRVDTTVRDERFTFDKLKPLFDYLTAVLKDLHTDQAVGE